MAISTLRQAEIDRKAANNIKLTNPDKEAQSLYDARQAQLTTEANRKADAGIQLAGNSKGVVSPFTQGVYDARTASNTAAASKGPEVSVSGGPAQSNNGSMIGSMYDDTYSSELQALRKARETAQQGLNSVESGAKQTAYQNRNLADSSTQKSAQRLRTIMAEQGLLSSGDNVTANVGLQAAGQSALNDINQTEGNTLRDVSERRGIIDNNSSLDEAALLKEVNAARSAALLEESRYQGDRELQIAGLTGQYGKTRTLAGQQLDLASQNQTWNQQFQQDQFGYQQARDQIADDRYKEEFDRDNERYGLEYALNRQIQLGQLSVQQGQLALSRSNATTDNSRQESNSNFDRLMSIWKATGVAPAGISNIAPGTPYKDGSSSSGSSDAFNLDDYKGFVNNNFFSEAPVDASNPMGAKQRVFDSAGARKYIIGLHLPDNQTDDMLRIYGLPTN